MHSQKHTLACVHSRGYVNACPQDLHAHIETLTARLMTATSERDKAENSLILQARQHQVLLLVIALVQAASLSRPPRLRRARHWYSIFVHAAGLSGLGIDSVPVAGLPGLGRNPVPVAVLSIDSVPVAMCAGPGLHQHPAVGPTASQTSAMGKGLRVG